jgi:hypothetical protein
MLIDFDDDLRASAAESGFCRLRFAGSVVDLRRDGNVGFGLQIVVDTALARLGMHLWRTI